MKTRQGSNARKAIQLVLATGVAVGAAQAQAATDLFLTITGLPGESVDDKHKDAIDVISVSQAVDNKDCTVAIFKGIDKATPGFVSAAATKGSFGSATLIARKAGKGQQEFFTITMTNVTVTNASHSLSRDGTPAEEIVLVPKSMLISYRPQNADGSLGAPVETTANCK